MLLKNEVSVAGQVDIRRKGPCSFQQDGREVRLPPIGVQVLVAIVAILLILVVPLLERVVVFHVA